MAYKNVYYLNVSDLPTSSILSDNATSTATTFISSTSAPKSLTEMMSDEIVKEVESGLLTPSLPNVHFSAKKDDWCTPQEVLDAIAWMGPIRLDPCSNKNSIVPAVFKYDLEDGFDGLKQPWGYSEMVNHYGSGVKQGLIFINPPYGKTISQWTKRAVNTFLCHPGDEIVMLVPSRTDTKWWHEVTQFTKAVCFWKGRLQFLGATSSAPFPSALLYFGGRETEFRKNLADKGWCTTSK